MLEIAQDHSGIQGYFKLKQHSAEEGLRVRKIQSYPTHSILKSPKNFWNLCTATKLLDFVPFYLLKESEDVYSCMER